LALLFLTVIISFVGWYAHVENAIKSSILICFA
jgi:hypothetical protein